MRGAQLASAVSRILEWRAGVVRGSAYMSARCHAHHDVKPSVGMLSQDPAALLASLS